MALSGGAQARSSDELKELPIRFRALRRWLPQDLETDDNYFFD